MRTHNAAAVLTDLNQFMNEVGLVAMSSSAHRFADLLLENRPERVGDRSIAGQVGWLDVEPV